MLRATPDAPGLHVFHGLPLAYLGRHAEAIAEGERESARWRPKDNYTQRQLVPIYMLAGQQDKALETLEPLIKGPYFLSPAWLRIDPNLVPLYGNAASRD